MAGIEAYLREQCGGRGAVLKLAVPQGASQQLAARRAQALCKFRGQLAARLPRAARRRGRILCILQLKLLRPQCPAGPLGRARCPTASKQA